MSTNARDTLAMPIAIVFPKDPCTTEAARDVTLYLQSVRQSVNRRVHAYSNIQANEQLRQTRPSNGERPLSIASWDSPFFVSSTMLGMF